MSDATPSIEHRFGASLDVRTAGGARLRYRHGPSLPKPCFHPIVTPAGVTISGFEMSDHVWHRGLWFTIKFVNGENFWEEQEPFGRQVDLTQPEAHFAADGSVRFGQSLQWSRPNGEIVIGERRVVRVATHAGGTTVVDFTTRLTPRVDVTLDRTPYTTWGGYGGLSFRGSREWHDVRLVLPDGSSHDKLVGERNDWAMLSGRVDGGAERRVHLAMIDHPKNPGGPVPWYGHTKPGITFLNAAFLFHGPMQLAADASLKLRYRVVFGDGAGDVEHIASLASTFRHEKEEA